MPIHAVAHALRRAISHVVTRVLAVQRELIIIAGQSNATGLLSFASTLTDTSLALPYPAVRYRAHLANNADPPAVETFGLGDLRKLLYVNVGANIVGVEVSMARAMDAEEPDNWAVSKFSANGTTLATQWLPTALYPTAPPNMFTQMVQFSQATMAATGCSRVAAFVWIHSEQDAASAPMAAAYLTNLITLATAVRAAFGDIPFLYNRLHISCAAAETATVRTAQEAFYKTFPYATMIDSDGFTLGGDGYHYASDALTGMGYEFSDALIAARASTTMTASLAESADPLTTPSQAFSYAVTVTNTGVENATAVYANLTLPVGCVYVSAGSGGTGWTMSSSGQVVTATRATMAAGAAPAITVNATAPATGTTMVANLSVVASNVPTAATDSETTTLTFPTAIPTFQAAGAAVSGAGTISPAWPAHQTDDIALLHFEQYQSAADPGIPALAVPAGFTLLSSKLSTYNTTFLARHSVFWARATGAAMTAPTIADTHTNCIAEIITVRGCTPTGSPVDVMGTEWANNTYAKPVTIPGATTTGANRLVVALWGGYGVSVTAASASACAALSDVTERTDVFGSACNLETATGGLAVAGTYGNFTAAMSGDSVMAGLTIALKP